MTDEAVLRSKFNMSLDEVWQSHYRLEEMGTEQGTMLYLTKCQILNSFFKVTPSMIEKAS